jgi:hypothetical protein
MEAIIGWPPPTCHGHSVWQKLYKPAFSQSHEEGDFQQIFELPSSAAGLTHQNEKGLYATGFTGLKNPVHPANHANPVTEAMTDIQLPICKPCLCWPP